MERKEIQIFKNILLKYKSELDSYINGTGDFSKVCYKEGVDKEFGSYDINTTNRYKIAAAILFLTQPASPKEEDITRKLFIEEIKARENDDWQGIGDNLQILAACLYEYHKDEDIKLFERAKDANFDTFCGFEVNPSFYTRTVENLTIDDCIYILYNLEEKEVLPELVDIWKNQQTIWNEDTYRNMKEYNNYIGNYDEELKAISIIASFKEKFSPQSFYIGQEYMDKLVKYEKYEKAFFILKEYKKYFKTLDNWESAYSAREFANTCMNFIINDNNCNRRIFIWNYVKPYLKNKQKSKSISLMENVIKASGIMREYNLKKKFKKLCLKEKSKYNFS